MPYILTATDFTDTADNAVHYACKLALFQNIDILLLHCYTIPVMFSEMPVPTPTSDAEGVAEESMNLFLTTLKSTYPQLTINSAIIYGDIVDAIEDYTEKNGPPMLVVTGNNNSEDNQAWMDSTLLEALRHLRFPVLAVPPGTEYRRVRKIGFAYDNKYEGSDIALVELRELTTLMNAELHVLYAEHDAMTREATHEINQPAKTILSPVAPLYHVFYEKDTDAAIMEFAAKYQIDWLAIMPRKHSFFEGLFHKSHTRVIVNFSQVPVLALHHNS